jgi:type II secretory pathway component PulF
VSTSNIFDNLATLSEAGVSTLEAARRVAESHPEITAWEVVIKKLSVGNKLSLALSKAGLISNFEKEILTVSEFSGRTAEGLREIAVSYDKRRQRLGRLKSKLYLPISILFIAIAVSSILSVANNPNSTIMWVTIKALFLMGIVLIVTKSILSILSKDVSGLLNRAGFLQNTKFYKNLFEQTVFSGLLWMVKSGIDFKNGFIRVSKILKAKHLQQQLKIVSHSCEQGNSVMQSINQANLPITKDLMQILNAAEASGNWEYSLQKYLEQQIILLDLQIDEAFEWAPRLYYIISAFVAITVIL